MIALLAAAYVVYRGEGDPCMAKARLIVEQSDPVLAQLRSGQLRGRGAVGAVAAQPERLKAAAAEEMLRAAPDTGRLRCIYQYFRIALEQDAARGSMMRQAQR